MNARLLTNLGLLMALLLIAGVGYISYRGVSRLVENAEWVAHTHQVQASIQRASAEMEKAQSTQRGYVIIGQEGYRQDYREAVRQVVVELDTLRMLTAKIGPQQERLDVLEQLVQRRVALLDEVIRWYDAGGFAAAQPRIEAGGGTELMDSIRLVFEQMELEEDVLLEQRTRLAEASAARSLHVLILGSGLAALLLLGAGTILNRDIGLRRKREVELRRALDAAAAASRAKTQFLATVSHEIRTPLNAVIGMTELIRDTPLSSEQADFARTVHSNAEALLFLINDMLDSSKIEAGQVDLEEIPFDIRDVVDGVVEILGVRSDAKGLELVADVQSDLPERFLGDPNRLRQILMNLVGNAIKFTERGEVSVHVSAGGPKTSSDRMEVDLEVRDTGVGIAPQDQGRVFERFIQADASTNRRFGGTGLGLSISQALTELMGGRVTLKSEPGRGSTFRVSLPLRVPVAGVAPVAAFALLRGVPAVIVEPNMTARQAVEAALESVGMHTTAFGTAADALAHIRSVGTEATQVVIAADRLPDGSGGDLARSLHQEKFRARVVLLCALHSQAAPVGRGAVVDCVYKPVKQRRLLEAVARAVSPQQGVSAPAAHARAAVRPQRAAAPRVLLAEDNQDNWTLTTRLLTAAGYEVDLAENGERATERAARFRYDLILMDLEMPVLDGFEATARIRQHERESGSERTPIVALTAHAVEGFRERALESGMDDYTTKPIKREQLLATVERWVDARPVVLVVDDSPENQTLVRNYLKRKQLRLVTAHNGREGLEAFQRQRVSLILLDMEMPLMDGYEAARAIRRTDEGRSVPILAMTGYEGPEERQKCLNAGCSFYVSKPIRRTELLEVVDTLLGASPDPGGPLVEPDARKEPAPPAGTFDGHREHVAGIKQRIARRDFDGIREIAGLVGEAAERSGLPELSRMSEEVAGAAAREDPESAALWARRLTERLLDEDRLTALRRTGLLDAPAEESFDRFTRLASKMIGVPVSLISLVDADRQFFLSQCGLPEPWATARETPLSHSFCQHVVHSSEPLIVDDARAHPLVRENLAVRDVDVIAYAGLPITSADGQLLGSFCAIDTRPRHWTNEEISILRDFAAAVSNEIQLRQALGQEEVGGAAREPVRTDERAQGDARPGPEASGESRIGVVATIDDDLADLVPDFLASRQRDVARIRELLGSADFREIQRLGHNMKGSGEGYGFPEVTTIGREIEDAAKEGAADQVAAAADRLAGYLGALTVRTLGGETIWQA
jgi:signal transduction histidine kinase/CheY-like chemotaxis protein/HPt (histidine-containing phosphotransfer) domain-containing protein